MKFVRGDSASYSGSSGCSGTATLPLPPLLTRSRPWSKNCPNSVNHELNGAESPSSGARLGMNHCCGVAGSASWSCSTAPGTLAAASAAAGLLSVWSTIRLLMIRGSGSKTNPDFCAYDVGTPDWAGPIGPSGSNVRSPAARKFGSSSRGNCCPEAPYFERPSKRLLKLPSTVRSP